MEPILEEIRATFDCGIWYPVVSATLMLPDACGAVEYAGSGKRPKDRYQDWYNEWVLPHYDPEIVKFDGEVVYRIRNAMIHETTGFVRGVDGFDRVLFMPPRKDGNVMDWCLSGGDTVTPESAFEVSIERFFSGVEQGVRAWLVEVRSDADKRRADALSKLIQLHPNGVEPHIVGTPLVA